MFERSSPSSPCLCQALCCLLRVAWRESGKVSALRAPCLVPSRRQGRAGVVPSRAIIILPGKPLPLWGGPGKAG